MNIECVACEGVGGDCLVCGGSGDVNILPSYQDHPHARDGRMIGSTIIGHVALKTNVFESYIVLEELDATEHNGLTDAQKDGVLHLLACGKVDLNDGKAGKTRLWNWFGAESTTVASLTALLS